MVKTHNNLNIIIDYYGYYVTKLKDIFKTFKKDFVFSHDYMLGDDENRWE